MSSTQLTFDTLRDVTGAGLDHVAVLESTNRPDGTTRYIDQVVGFADPRFEFRYLSIRNLFRRTDVFHIHWPEAIVRGHNAIETAIRCALLRVAVRLMRFRRTAIVRTVHNLEPHEVGGAVERRTLRWLDASTDLFVTINSVTKAPGQPSVLIPHGHYRDRFAGLARSDRIEGRCVYAGMIRPYKGVEQLLDVFGKLTAPGASLHIVGKPTPELRGLIEAATAGDERIRASFGFVPDEELVCELTAASLVCLPYSELHNSGMMLVALSVGRPVLVPNTATTRVLAEEVGDGWVHRFDGPLTTEILHDALRRSSESPPDGEPRLNDRDWEMVGRRYGDAFDQAVQLKRRPK